MPLPTSMGFSLSEAEVTTIETALTTIATVLNGKANINLSPDERRSARAVAEGRRPYLDKTFDTLGPNYPALRPNFLDFDADRTNHAYGKQLRGLLILMGKVSEVMEDHTLSAENLAYRWMLKFYNSSQAAQDTNTPGTDTVIAELSPLFEQSNPTPKAAEAPSDGGQ